jgi:hypothetical protein
LLRFLLAIAGMGGKERAVVKKTRRPGLGMTLLGLCVSVSAAGLALAMAVSVCCAVRREARVAAATTKLRGISTALGLHFNVSSKYPKQGANLAETLADFVQDRDVFANPLMSEPALGYTVSALYQEPTLREADRPENYLTAMISDDGETVVVLKTLGKVDRVVGLDFDPRSLLSSFNAAGRRLVVVRSSTTRYTVRASASPGSTGEDLRGGGTRFEEPQAALGGNGRLQAHVLSIPVTDGSAVWNVSVAVETPAGSTGPVDIPKSEADVSQRLGLLREVGLGFWAQYRVSSGEVRVTLASDGQNTPDPLTGLTIYVSGTEVLAANAESQEAVSLDLE